MPRAWGRGEHDLGRVDRVRVDVGRLDTHRDAVIRAGEGADRSIHRQLLGRQLCSQRSHEGSSAPHNAQGQSIIRESGHSHGRLLSGPLEQPVTATKLRVR